MTRIPRLPAAPILAGDPAAEPALAAAAAGPGMMLLTGADAALGLDPDIRPRLLKLFALPDPALRALARAKFEPANRNVYRGAFPAQPGDVTYKRGADLGPDLADPARADPADPLTEPTPAPDPAQLPGWREDAAAYHAAMERLGRALLRALARGLGLDAAALDARFEGGISTLRLLDYPERPADAAIPDDARLPGEARTVVGRAHRDNGFVTLLWQDPQGGLQARTPDGAWADVPPEPGALAVNFGRLLADLTGGRACATEHRVLGGRAARTSIPFFLEPAVDAPIETAAGPRPYGDLLWERMKDFVEFRGVERRPAA